MGLSRSIGSTISDLRVNLGMTPEEIAKEAGISRQHYSDVENGVERVSVDILLKIANGMGLSLIGLLEKVEFVGVQSFVNPHEKEDSRRVEVDQKLSLFYNGDKALLKSSNRVTIIGKKKPTEYGLQVSEVVTKWFVNRGFVIVSGLEVGIDTTVHATCLELGGKSIAVLNSGLRNINPKKSKELADKIVQAGGLLLSKHRAPVFSKLSHNLDSREIQVKIGHGVIIIESQLGSNEMTVGINVIKTKGKIACVKAPKKNWNTTQGNMILIRDHKEEVFVLNKESLPEFEKMLVDINSSR